MENAIENIREKILLVIEENYKYVMPKDVGFELIKMGANLLLYCAPSDKMAFEVILSAIDAGIKMEIKNEYKRMD